MAEARSLLPDSEEAEFARQPARPRRYIVAAAALGAVGALVALGVFSSGRKEDEHAIVSRGPLGEELTVLEENACDLYPYLKFELPGAVLNNNLANKGPDKNGEGIAYKTVDLGQGAGDELDKEVFLTVNATSLDYKPFSPRLNGMQGKYGSINLNSGSSVDLLYNFYDVETGDKLTLPEFAMTWFDLDTGRNQHSVEYVIIGGFKSYHLTKRTEVKVEKQPDGRTKFSASTYGTGEDNPKDPMFLTQQQKNRAVTLLFGSTQQIDVTIGATSGRGPRFFTFVGRPSLLCAVTVQQNFKPPLPDLTFSPPMQKGVMSTEGEEFVSFAVPKGAKVKEGDLIATTKKDGKIIEHRAPFDGTVTQMQDQLKPGEKLDMRLSEKILAVVERPSLANLPQDEATGVIGGGPGEDVHTHAHFKKYLVDVGDSVSAGEDIALAENSHGEEVKIQSTGYGVVEKRQEGMKPGMILASVPDGNLITLGKYPGLGPTGADSAAAATVPDGGEGQTFKEYHVKKGDIIKVGDPIATVIDKDGNEQVIKATHGGVVSDLEDLKEGTPMDRMEGDTICTTGKFPPLPVQPGQAPIDSTGAAGSPAAGSPSGDQTGAPSETDAAAAAAGGAGEDPLPEQGDIPQDGLKFVKYYVAPKDVVETGDPLAQVEDKDGNTHDILAPRPGVVTAIQDGLKEGMVLDNVMTDKNVAVIDKLPVLDITDSEDGNFAPPAESWKFKEWKVQKGDSVKKGDAIAILENPATGETKEITAARTGEVTKTLDHIKPGDDVEETTGDSDLATIGLSQGPDIGFREMGVDVDPDCTFEDWRIEEGQKVHFGDPIADVKLPGGTDSSGRRLSSLLTIPSPGTGHISYMADLKPGQKISQRTASPTIAKVDLGLPWWLTLLAALCALCCCFGCLYKIMQKQPAYKPMPPVVAPAPEPEPPAPAPKKPDGLRLDFNDKGTVRTVYAKYKPLGIKHNHTAPIIAHDFTCNSYAKQALGVQPDWKLTRIGDEELNESNDFDAVNEKLSRHMKDFPIWPLPLEFRKSPDDPDTHTYKFIERPLGMEFTNVAPIKVDRVYESSPAAEQKVETGWFLTKIGDVDVHETTNFREVLKYFKEGVQGLFFSGTRLTECHWVQS